MYVSVCIFSNQFYDKLFYVWCMPLWVYVSALIAWNKTFKIKSKIKLEAEVWQSDLVLIQPDCELKRLKLTWDGGSHRHHLTYPVMWSSWGRAINESVCCLESDGIECECLLITRSPTEYKTAEQIWTQIRSELQLQNNWRGGGTFLCADCCSTRFPLHPRTDDQN